MLAAGETGEQDLKSRTLSPDNVCKVFHRPGNLELSNLSGMLTLVVSIAQREWHWGIQRGDRRRAQHPRCRIRLPSGLPEAAGGCVSILGCQFLSWSVLCSASAPGQRRPCGSPGDSKRHCLQMYVVQGLGLGRTSCEHGIIYVLSFCFIDGFLRSCFWGVIQFGSGVLCNVLMSPWRQLGCDCSLLTMSFTT